MGCCCSNKANIAFDNANPCKFEARGTVSNMLNTLASGDLLLFRCNVCTARAIQNTEHAKGWGHVGIIISAADFVAEPSSSKLPASFNKKCRKGYCVCLPDSSAREGPLLVEVTGVGCHVYNLIDR